MLSRISRRTLKTITDKKGLPPSIFYSDERAFTGSINDAVVMKKIIEKRDLMLGAASGKPRFVSDVNKLYKTLQH
ncbi:hypothetical protein HDV06_003199 [Boothiomyces sp. JEL0866]|nr:hypothetical protein HDV06_003199 [Boothiomyces sp. JEL0866]